MRERGLGGIGAVKDIAGNDEEIDGVFPEISEEPIEKTLVLGTAVVIDQPGAKVPIGGVENGHSGEIGKCGNGEIGKCGLARLPFFAGCAREASRFHL